MTIEVRPSTLRDMCFVAAHVRDEDRREINATVRLKSMTEAAVLSYFGAETSSWCVFLDGSPIAAFGYSPRGEFQPHICSAWAWGTNKFKRAVPAISRFCRTNWPAVMDAEGLTRCEIRSLADHDIAHSWLKSLGSRYEGTLRGYGVGGEDFELWALRIEDFR